MTEMHENFALKVKMGEYEVELSGTREEVLKTIEDFPTLVASIHKAFENVKPKTVIGGPKNGFNGPNGPIAVHAPTGMILVSTRVDSGEESQLNNEGQVAVWSIHDNGDVPPRWTIGKGFLKVPRGIALDPEARNFVVSDKIGNRILTFHLPEIY